MMSKWYAFALLVGVALVCCSEVAAEEPTWAPGDRAPKSAVQVSTSKFSYDNPGDRQIDTTDTLWKAAGWRLSCVADPADNEAPKRVILGVVQPLTPVPIKVTVPGCMVTDVTWEIQWEASPSVVGVCDGVEYQRTPLLPKASRLIMLPRPRTAP